MMQPALELQKVFQADAADLLAARERARIIHGARDIDDSGDEVEIAARTILARHLPTKFNVGHGHVVDSEQRCSCQHDVLVTDNSETPVLFATRSGAEYYPYESVYAVGEIKTTYDKGKQPIQAFSRCLGRLRAELEREETPRNYLGNQIRVGPGFNVDVREPYRNPLFAFMIFADGGDFELKEVKKIFGADESENLPNAVLVLSRGLIVNCRVVSAEEPWGMNLYPEFNEYDTSGSTNRWMLVNFGQEEFRLGANLAALYFLLVSHLEKTRLMLPRMQRYLMQYLPAEAQFESDESNVNGD